MANPDAAQQNGDSADPFIASAYAFGARDFDVPEALADMVKGATDPTCHRRTIPSARTWPSTWPRGTSTAGTFDLTSLPYTVGGSETLEYAIDDFAISQLAQAAGDAADARRSWCGPRTGRTW